MPRARNIKPAFFTNDELAECEPLARIMFIGLWSLADREGRLVDRPRKIKAETLPYDDCDADALLIQLHKRGFIVRYKAEDIAYIQVVNFIKHQNCHMKESASTIPAPCKEGASPIPIVPLTESPLLNPESLTLKAEPVKKPRAKKVSLGDLSVDHISEWLSKKRVEGKYMNHDENAILETFKNYCESKGKKYENFIAAYRNAFTWDRCQPKVAAPISKHQRARIALGLDQTQPERSSPIDVTPANML